MPTSDDAEQRGVGMYVNRNPSIPSDPMTLFLMAQHYRCETCGGYAAYAARFDMKGTYCSCPY